MTLALLFLGLSIVCRACAELQQHKKLRWTTTGFGFFGEDSYLRKYRNGHSDKSKFQVQIPLDNWYYNFFKVRYREAFPLSSTILVFVTDFYHLMQFIYHLCLALSVSLLTDINFFIVWPGIVFIHALTYKLLQR